MNYTSSFPGSAWERTVPEALPPRKKGKRFMKAIQLACQSLRGGASPTVRSQAEPGNEGNPFPRRRVRSPQRTIAYIVIFLALTHSARAADSVLRDFVSVRGDQLMEGGKPFRFISFNIPNLHLVEDNLAFTEENPWRLPDRFEIYDALASVRQQGGQVVRTYVLSVARAKDPPGTPRHVLGPGKFNEEAFRALDLLLQTANETGMRVIVPFVDNWSWWGGKDDYAGFRGKQPKDFWTDPQVIADFKETIRFVLERTNTLTGVKYRDDKAILAWETGNELESPAAWTREIAAYIKTLDRNHPVIDGYHNTVLREESLAMPEVDIVTTHHYPTLGMSFAKTIRENAAKAKGRKPYFVGEFGFVDFEAMKAVLDAVQETGTSGALLWSLRPRNRDGGFYWHSEPLGGDKYKAYHWPGFKTGDTYDEMPLMKLMQDRAYAIRGLPTPPLEKPAPPKLLPIESAAAISWQGSVGAESYQVERASQEGGPWAVAEEDIDETATQYRPQFADAEVTKGNWFYRVRACNAAGVSEPSNVVGPVKVEYATIVNDFYKIMPFWEPDGDFEFAAHNCRTVKEDIARLAGRAGTSLTYEVSARIRACRLYVFFPREVADFRFFISGKNTPHSIPMDAKYTELPCSKNVFFSGAGEYGYWKPVLFTCKPDADGPRFLKIEFPAEAQISRIEIDHDFPE
jgi:mannan endo-1,4-beta-mannosidase